MRSVFWRTWRGIAAGVLSAAFLLHLTACMPAPAASVAPERVGEAGQLERDRQAILAMAGDYAVRFDFRETVAFVPGYKPIAAKVSGGHEVVRVIEDQDRLVRLQHLLVVEIKGKPVVIKHWRQDWQYEPSTVLVYVGPGRWVSRKVPPAERQQAWSQTVYQTDDSPRYGGVGRWEFDNGVARWSSDPTWRPLARRDAIRHPPYDRYLGTNRQALTPTGWVHEQDNAKIGEQDGKRITFTHETVLNSYTRTADFPVAAADGYWAKTKDYWAAVRAAWDEALVRDGALTVTEEADNGSLTGPRLMELAEEVADGTVTLQSAVAEARAIIAGTRKPPAR